MCHHLNLFESTRYSKNALIAEKWEFSQKKKINTSLLILQSHINYLPYEKSQLRLNQSNDYYIEGIPDIAKSVIGILKLLDKKLFPF